MTEDDVIRAWKECKFYSFAKIGNSDMSLYTVESMKKNKVWYECIEHNLRQPIYDNDVYLVKQLWVMFPDYVESFDTLLKWFKPHFDLSNIENKK